MNVIKDIRVYRSRSENIAGNSMPQGFANRELNIILHRIAMKLRENDFSMGDFNHLYVNLTTCAVEDKLAASKRERDKTSGSQPGVLSLSQIHVRNEAACRGPYSFSLRIFSASLRIHAHSSSSPAPVFALIGKKIAFGFSARIRSLAFSRSKSK